MGWRRSGEIDDGEATVTGGETCFRIGPGATRVGIAIRHAIGHGASGGEEPVLSVRRDESGHAAQDSSLSNAITWLWVF
jgi:hypothetical protein